jgi:hypothetical protein
MGLQRRLTYKTERPAKTLASGCERNDTTVFTEASAFRLPFWSNTCTRQ